jgi:hypothetical protein
LVEREGHITGNGEVVKRSVNQSLLRVASTHCRLDLPKALADEQGPIDKHAVGRAVDLEVTEQDIGAKEGQDLVDAIVGFAVGGNIDIESIRGQGG